MSLNLLNILESIITLSIFYVFYMILLRKETFFKLNRIYLLSSLIFAVTIPFLDVTYNFWEEANTDDIINKLANLRQGYFELNEVIIYAYGGKSVWYLVLEYFMVIYLLGVIISLLFFCLGTIQIILILHKSTPKNYGRYKVVESTKILIPFSLFRWIIINPEKYSSKDMEQIIAHERMHAFQLHSIDLIIVEVLVILFWFNPFIYWYRKSIREVHEYLADRAVVENGYDRIDYQQLLLSQFTGCRNIGLTSRFSYSLSKNRLKMLTMMKSRSISKIKVALIIPFTLLAIFLFVSKKDMAIANDHTVSGLKEKFAHDTTKNEIVIVEDKDINEKVYFTCDIMPKFQGKESDEFRFFIQKNLKYPEEAIKKGLQGKVYVQFDVDKKGKVDNIKVVRGANEILNSEAIRVTASSPKWEPGIIDGKPVRVRFTFPITFALNKEESK